MPLPAPTANPFYALLGRAPSVVNQLPILDDQRDRTIKAFSDCIYHSYKPLGLAFSFLPQDVPMSECATTPDHASLVLDAIDVYNGDTKDFCSYKSDVPLPCSIQTDMQAHDIVALLGEPDRKGGGTRVPCWIDYKLENNAGGIMIQLHGLDWEDRKMGWTSLVIYR
ncbi:hypothetical protein BC940DRAFT_300898 [Gongronella butleri]|nr:hypothetical protein BC940DRAFT_300898 [Gongronella butleri]